MDKSLDQLIKENRRKNVGKGVNKKTKGVALQKKQGGGNVMKAKSRIQKQKMGGKLVLSTKAGNKAVGKPMIKKTAGRVRAGQVTDARAKLLAKKQQKITDARERISSKKVDLRQKLAKKKENNNQRRTPPARPRQRTENQIRSPTVQLTRTIFNNSSLLRDRTYGRSPLQRRVPDVDLPQRDVYDVGMKRSSAAMDWEPMVKRTRVLDSRLGPKEVTQPVMEPAGYKVVIDDLHPTVTQEDIEELFGDIGPLIKALLRRPGYGEVVFSHRQDAIRAVDVYHNRQLDGMPMRVSLSEHRVESQQVIQPAPSTRPSSGKGNIQPDISTIHKALFNKTGSKSQVFTVTLPKKEF